MTVERGIRKYEHLTRKYRMRPDAYYALRYKVDGKSYEEGLGWASEGWTLEKVRQTLAELRAAKRTGDGPITLQEKRNKAKAMREAERDEQERLTSLTLRGVFEGGYLANQQAKGKSPTTIGNETNLLNSYIAPFFGDVTLYKIDVRLMDQFLAFINGACSKRTGKPLSNSTKRHIIALVSQIFNYATSRIDNSLQNPVRLISKPKSDDARERFLTVEEARILLAALAERSKYTHDMALLALFCGLRAGEILSLTWASVNFVEKTLFIKNTKNKSNRHAYMTAEVEAMLHERHNGQGEGEQKFDDRVFHSPEIPNTFERTVKALGFNEGREDRRDRVVFHTLRHTFASWHAKAGTPLYTIAKLLGHKTLSMTQRYAHLCPEAERQAAMTLQGVLSVSTKANVTPFKQAK